MHIQTVLVQNLVMQFAMLQMAEFKRCFRYYIPIAYLF
jgi:hypothetical protein